MPSSPPPQNFLTTRWTVVAQARGDSAEARVALSDLCAAYYAPVHSFIRLWVKEVDQADDLTQEFFARVLADDESLRGADKSKGRFRSFLLGAVKHFLSKMREASLTKKRGGGVEFQPLATSNATGSGFDVPDAAMQPPDAAFDRQWAMTSLAHALQVLEAEFDAEGKSEAFRTLKPWLTGADQPQSVAAEALGMTETAVKVAIHRLRQRFRQKVRDQLAQTLDPSASVDEEMQHLFAALVG